MQFIIQHWNWQQTYIFLYYLKKISPASKIIGVLFHSFPESPLFCCWDFIRTRTVLKKLMNTSLQRQEYHFHANTILRILVVMHILHAISVNNWITLLINKYMIMQYLHRHWYHQEQSFQASAFLVPSLQQLLKQSVELILSNFYSIISLYQLIN